MITTLVDSNVLFDHLTEDLEWFDWSSAMLAAAASAGAVAINQIIYAEVSVRYTSIEDLDVFRSETETLWRGGFKRRAQE